MNIVVAPDSFKESLTALRAAEAISEGITRIFPEAEIVSIPFADGGEGTVEAIVAATNGRIIKVPSVDALNRPILSFYGILGDGETAVIEMAAASGIELLTPGERNPLVTTTFGTGLLIKEALNAGFTQIIIGIGGSATNDGGSGMAQALGFKLLDADGNHVGFGGGSLGQLQSIDSSDAHPLLKKAKITVACDVRNPLLGPSGATRIYGPQKGANQETLEILESNLTNFARILLKDLKTEVADQPGAGAAGGLGAGMMAFCKAEIVSGFELINELTKLEEKIKNATLIFTAEGKIDSQSAYGKTVSGIAKLGKKYQVPVIVLAGIVQDDLNLLYEQGVTSVFALSDQPMSIEESKDRAFELLADTSERIMRLVRFFK